MPIDTQQWTSLYDTVGLRHCAARQGVDVVVAKCATLTQSLNAARATGECGIENRITLPHERGIAELPKANQVEVYGTFGAPVNKQFPR